MKHFLSTTSHLPLEAPTGTTWGFIDLTWQICRGASTSLDKSQLQNQQTQQLWLAEFPSWCGVKGAQLYSAAAGECQEQPKSPGLRCHIPVLGFRQVAWNVFKEVLRFLLISLSSLLHLLKLISDYIRNLMLLTSNKENQGNTKLIFSFFKRCLLFLPIILPPYPIISPGKLAGYKGRSVCPHPQNVREIRAGKRNFSNTPWARSGWGTVVVKTRYCGKLTSIPQTTFTQKI